MLIFLNFFLIAMNSSSAVPFTTMLGLFALWLLLAAPLCFVGAYFGFKQERTEQPVRTNQIPRQIPTQVRRKTMLHLFMHIYRFSTSDLSRRSSWAVSFPLVPSSSSCTLS